MSLYKTASILNKYKHNDFMIGSESVSDCTATQIGAPGKEATNTKLQFCSKQTSKM